MLRELLAAAATFCRSSSHGMGISTPGRAKRGIWAGKTVITGHNVSYSNRRTNRKFFPNIQKKFYWSHLLGRWFRINVTTHALRCIDRVGGLDEFLLYSKPKLLSESEFALKTRKVLIAEWEKENKRKFNRSQLIYEARLEQLGIDKRLQRKRWNDIKERQRWIPGVDEEILSQKDFKEE
mmetsp:Transcript_23945/g.36384  ORF Transcript_23945/g.36384 Transcript_23945/m.36384 type:complete len:180 (+) Transcript_23945:19-558(+)